VKDTQRETLVGAGVVFKIQHIKTHSSARILVYAMSDQRLVQNRSDGKMNLPVVITSGTMSGRDESLQLFLEESQHSTILRTSYADERTIVGNGAIFSWYVRVMIQWLE
jgi:hypothetical protein